MTPGAEWANLVSHEPRQSQEERILRTGSRRSVLLLLVATVALGTVLATGASAGTQKKAAGGEVCVLFPDPATSIRWVHYDAPAMKAELAKAGVSAQIFNANGSAQTKMTPR